MRRELVLVLRAPATWAVLALCALSTGHALVVGVDVFSASSRSAAAGTLMARLMDPLLGVARPALSGLELATVVLLPLLCVRSLANEKERGSFGALCLEVGSPSKVVLQKLIAACGIASVAPLLSVLGLCAYAIVGGGTLDVVETSVAVGGHLLHAVLVAAIAVAAASWTRSHAQAIAFALVLSLASWAIDASGELAALAWLARARDFSIDTHLARADQGVFALADFVWLVSGALGAAALAAIGARFDWEPRKRVGSAIGALAVTIIVLLASSSTTIGFQRDWTEQRRASLPPPVEAGLRTLGPIAITIRLDRDDSRRWQLERDFLAKLAIARPDARITMPYDARSTPAEMERDPDYGTIVLEVGDGKRKRETHSTSRKELTTLLFEAADVPLPSWDVPPYAGHPSVIEGTRRLVLATFVYLVFPGGLLLVSLGARRRKR